MPNTVSNGTPAASVAGHLRQEFDAARALLHAQPPLTQRFVEAQARQLAEAMAQKLTQIRFTLPDRVIGPGSDAQPVSAISIVVTTGKTVTVDCSPVMRKCRQLP